VKLRGWAVAVFAAALLARLGFLFLVDQPLLYSHQYTYFTSALRIAEHPHPLPYLLGSDGWRTWDDHWTIAPLYYLFAAGVFRVFGPHLLPLLLIQCTFDSIVAVCVAALGRRLAGPRGAWAGIAYALHWPAFEMPSWTMTENVHTLLFVGGILVLARDDAPPRSRLAGGFLVGVSALARSVSSAFLAAIALVRLWRDGLKRGLVPVALILAGGASAILPWIARNVALGQPPTIETAAYENIWWANHFGDQERYRRQKQVVYSQKTPEATRAAALHFALKAIRERPDLFAGKVWDNFWHFLRLDWLDSLLRVERPAPTWQYAAGIVTEDLVLVVLVPLFLVFLLAGHASPARDLIVLWTAYYLFMVVVVFHNELRYRSALAPFAFAGAAGGWALLADRDARRRLPVRAALVLGLAIAFGMLKPYAAASWRALAAARAPSAEAASALDPRSARPWIRAGRRLIAEGRTAEAIDAYRRAAKSGKPDVSVPTLVLPRLLAEAGRDDEAAAALRNADVLSFNTDPWLALETAWRELPAPRADQIVLGRGDYGAVRGFFHPRGGDPALTRRFLTWNSYESPDAPQPRPGPHRWTRSRAWLRLLPTQAATEYIVTLEMGAPFPSTLVAPVVVSVSVGGGSPTRFTLDAEVRPYTLRAPAARSGEPITVRIDAPTWCRPGEPAEQGVRVDRLSVAPAP
jgi:hypothetical protein